MLEKEMNKRKLQVRKQSYHNHKMPYTYCNGLLRPIILNSMYSSIQSDIHNVKGAILLIFLILPDNLHGNNLVVSLRFQIA